MFGRALRPVLIAAAFFVLAGRGFAADVSTIVSQVSYKSYASYLSRSLYTSDGFNRGPYGPQHDRARTNIYNAFNSFGLETYLDPFNYNNSSFYNVVGVHQGKSNPGDVYVIGAHYDSVGNPGADDNASGTAAVMEAARVLSQYEFDATLVFIAFDLEELGLLGSRAYATKHRNDNILGMLSLDMIAYNPAGTMHDKAYIYGRESSNTVKYSLADAILNYGGGITPVVQGDMGASDHAAFEEKGFQAALLIEGGVWSNPNYHQASDSINTPNYLDFNYATRMTMGAVGYLATAAIPYTPTVPEPAGILTLGAGSVWLVLFMRRKTRV